MTSRHYFWTPRENVSRDTYFWESRKLHDNLGNFEILPVYSNHSRVNLFKQTSIIYDQFFDYGEIEPSFLYSNFSI